MRHKENNVKRLLLEKLDSYFKVQCSPNKGDNYKFLVLEEALEENFLRFGNKFFIPAVSIDIDFKSDVLKVISDNNLPEPTFIVETQKGTHIHWFLDNPIKTSNIKQLNKLKHIIRYLQGLFGADINATTGASGRIWRNPLKHTSVFSEKVVRFSEFILPEYEVELKKSVGGSKYAQQLFIDFNKIPEGERNSTLFQYGSAFAYTTGTVNITNDLLAKNSIFSKPLGHSEVLKIAHSINTFMATKYRKGNYKTSERTIQFNQRVAQRQADKKFDELYNKVCSNLAPLYSVTKITSRKAAEMWGISKNTFTKYKSKLIEKLKNIKTLIKAPLKFIDEASFKLTEHSKYAFSILTIPNGGFLLSNYNKGPT
jgi:hypothetical protein